MHGLCSSAGKLRRVARYSPVRSNTIAMAACLRTGPNRARYLPAGVPQALVARVNVVRIAGRPTEPARRLHVFADTPMQDTWRLARHGAVAQHDARKKSWAICGPCHARRAPAIRATRCIRARMPHKSIPYCTQSFHERVFSARVKLHMRYNVAMPTARPVQRIMRHIVKPARRKAPKKHRPSSQDCS